MNTNNLDKIDPLLKKAVELVVDSRKSSTTFIQRMLNIGYARAAQIIDQMEEFGIVGPSNGYGARSILIKNKDLNWNNINEMVRKANYRLKIIKIKERLKRVTQILAVFLFLYILNLFIGFEFVLLLGLAVIIEYLLSARSFYRVF